MENINNFDTRVLYDLINETTDTFNNKIKSINQHNNDYESKMKKHINTIDNKLSNLLQNQSDLNKKGIDLNNDFNKKVNEINNIDEKMEKLNKKIVKKDITNHESIKDQLSNFSTKLKTCLEKNDTNLKEIIHYKKIFNNLILSYEDKVIKNKQDIDNQFTEMKDNISETKQLLDTIENKSKHIQDLQDNINNKILSPKTSMYLTFIWLFLLTFIMLLNKII